MNNDMHRAVMISILRAIYSDAMTRSILGFKGGTAAMLFYKLPRLSVDLDFDLLDPEQKSAVFEQIRQMLPRFGSVVQAIEKRFTLFFLLSYKKGERQIKVEISKRASSAQFVQKNYLGIPMLVMNEEDMAAGKLSALLTRARFAARDLFDLWFFLEQGWEINEDLVKEKTGMSLADALSKARDRVESVKQTDLLAGLGELLDEKQKAWVREKLKDELVFQLRLRLGR